jgi:hypothetical protein
MIRTLDSERRPTMPERLEHAELTRAPIVNTTNDFPNMTFAHGHDVQWKIQRRERERDHRLVELFSLKPHWGTAGQSMARRDTANNNMGEHQ